MASHSCRLVSGQSAADATHDAGEEGLAEHPLLRLGDHQCHRVGPLGHQRPGGTVGHVPEFGDGLLDARPGPGLTCGDPFTTRDTVPRPTPARAATASRVGRPADRVRWVVMFSP